MGIKSFFDKIGAEIEKFFGSSTWEQKAIGFVDYAGPLAQTIVTLVAGAAVGTEVGNIMNQIKAGVGTVAVVAKDGNVAAGTPAAATAEAALSSINTNLAALLADAGVKNSTKLADIEAAANLITGETNALLAALPVPAPTPSPAPTPAPSPAQPASGTAVVTVD